MTELTELYWLSGPYPSIGKREDPIEKRVYKKVYEEFENKKSSEFMPLYNAAKIIDDKLDSPWARNRAKRLIDEEMEKEFRDSAREIIIKAREIADCEKVSKILDFVKANPSTQNCICANYYRETSYLGDGDYGTPLYNEFFQGQQINVERKKFFIGLTGKVCLEQGVPKLTLNYLSFRFSDTNYHDKNIIFEHPGWDSGGTNRPLGIKTGIDVKDFLSEKRITSEMIARQGDGLIRLIGEIVHEMEKRDIPTMIGPSKVLCDPDGKPTDISPRE